MINDGNTEQLIVKISSENPKIFPYFERFANFINYMYTQFDNFSMIELFDNGFFMDLQIWTIFGNRFKYFEIFGIMLPQNS